MTALLFGALATILSNNENQNVKIQDKFPVLLKTETNPELFWNTLQTDEDRFEVAECAFYFGRFTANYCWDNRNTQYKDLKKSQRNFIKFCLERKEYPYTTISLYALVKI